MVQQHWPLVHGKKPEKVHGKKRVGSKHASSGGSGHRRSLRSFGVDGSAGWGVGGDEMVVTWSEPNAESTVAPPIV